MILLCVDGIDPDLVTKWGYDEIFKYNYKLSIPQACFVPDVELGSTPHTTRVWPTIFAGQIIDYGLTRRVGLRKKIHELLVRSDITWKRRKKKFRIAPVNYKLDTIFDHYDSFAWNIPTITPEWLSNFPSYEDFVIFCERELAMWVNLTRGSVSGVIELEAYYLRYVDFVGHNNWKRLKGIYAVIFSIIRDLKKERKDEVILVSDHGCDKGLHTNYAYLGSDSEFEAKAVNEIRVDLERLLRNAGVNAEENV